MEHASVKLGEGGRIVIPADYRKALGVETGDELMLHMEHGRMYLLTRKQAIAYVQEQMARYQVEGTLSEELIMERKQQARDE